MSSDKVTMALMAGITLKDHTNWPQWFAYIRQAAIRSGIWGIVDPDETFMTEEEMLWGAPEPTTKDAYKILYAQAESTHAIELDAWKNTPADKQGLEPTLEPPSDALVKTKYHALRKDWTSARAEKTDKHTLAAIESLHRLILQSIDHLMQESVLSELDKTGQSGVRATLQIIRTRVAPSKTATRSAIIKQYDEHLAAAKRSGVEPTTWIQEYLNILSRAVTEDIPGIKETLFVINFLDAVAVRINPDWARIKKNEALEDERFGRPVPDLHTLALRLQAVTPAHSDHRSRRPGTYPTLDSSGSSTQPAKGGNATKKQHYQCPCGLANHKWAPIECRIFRNAVTGVSTDGKTMDSDFAFEIFTRFSEPKWNALRKQATKLGWTLISRTKPTSDTTPSSTTSLLGAPSPQLPRKFVSTILDPRLLAADEESLGVFTTFNCSVHQLSQSILLDNCGALHVVNDKSCLLPGTFVEAEEGDRAEAGTTDFPILGRGTWLLKNVLRGPDGPNTADLELTNVAVVENFHVNIISEARLLTSNVWYCGLDCTLRVGTLSSNTVIKQLVRKVNLVFFEYNPLFSCSSAPPSDVLSSMAGVILYQNALTPRNFGTGELVTLVQKRSGHCRSNRPFWRVSWDLFDFERGYDGSNWLLVIKDEFSRKLFALPLTSKSQTYVFDVLRRFENWVFRQFGLRICKIRQDRDTSTIGGAYRLRALDS
ncbi:hypothetical protein C8A05DRAFT_39082 [Staphylotrichum tortipilum]|uniref:Integrase catalytic domain-containing protein n=1 Tax=Staphylotrichum tortipilum TaxID=2831512 RepID=A0AAN6RPG3_9PEZI|nr:hypothetical protein C8A05DRAFT_39082 [Staphylotrichum longicolle]